MSSRDCSHVLSHFLLTIPAAGVQAEILAADCWALGAVGIEELPGGLRAAFTDLATARGARDALAPDAAINAFDDSYGIDAARDLLTVRTAGPFAVHPPWLEPPPGLIGIEVDPGHAFGSGSHASTRLALELLGNEQPTTVFDIGCGSGVLSIAAARLGATVVAVDIDPAAIRATSDNARRNGAADRVTVADGSADHLTESVDLVLVNVTIDIHEALAPLLAASHRRLIVAGVLGPEQLARCATAYRAVVEAHLEDDGWMAGVLTRS